MNKLTASLAALAAAASVFLIAAPAQALLNRTFVSGTGSDAGTCTRSAPCLSFPYAYSQTSAGGEINCIGPGSHGAVNIGKSISIICNGTEGGVHTAAGITVNAPTGSIVTLRGLNIDCLGTGIAGIRMVNIGVTLHVQETHIRGCRGSQGSAIKIIPSSGVAEVFVADNYITDSTRGVEIAPTGPAFVRLHVDRTILANNHTGVFATTYSSTGTTRFEGTIRDSAATGNSVGFQVHSQGIQAVLFLANVTADGNNVGLQAGATGAVMYVERSQIVHCVGIGVLAHGGGQIYSYGNNSLASNYSDGAFTAITLK